jgi:hypothetical protein
VAPSTHRSPGRLAAIFGYALIRIGLLFVAAALWTVPATASVREPILAGTWYPKDSGELRRDIEGFLGGESSPPPSGLAPLAIIVPHAGYIYSGATAGKGYAAVRGRAYDRVILIGPSHHVPFDGAALTSDEEDTWRTPLGDVALDQAAIVSLSDMPGFARIPEAHKPEHSLEIEVPFLQVALAHGFRIVPILIGSLDERRCGEIASAIRPLLGGGTLVVISSDFTHYGPNYDYIPFSDSVSTRLARMDGEAILAIEKISADDFERFRQRTRSTICGAEPIRVLLTLLRGRRVRVEKAGYAQSGSLMGDFTNSVSYTAMVFSPAGNGSSSSSGDSPSGDAAPGATGGSVGGGSGEPSGGTSMRPLNPKEQEFLTSLARATITAKLRGEKAPQTRAPEEFGADSPLPQVHGVFVTLTTRGRLRGCIGSIFGTEPLVDGVAHQASNAAFEDPRFQPLTAKELNEIHIEISVLTPPVAISGPQEIVVGRHGVLIEKGGYRAVFLPQVATEQGWDRETLLRQLCRKAGLGPDDWRSGAKFEVFEAQVFEEKGPHPSESK